MLWKYSRRFQFAADRAIPDSFVFCIILTLIVFALGLIFTAAGPMGFIWFIVTSIGPLIIQRFFENGMWRRVTIAKNIHFMGEVASRLKKYISIKSVRPPKAN